MHTWPKGDILLAGNALGTLAWEQADQEETE